LLAANGITALVGRRLANQLGVPLVPINPLLTPKETGHILSDSGSADLIVEEQFHDKANQALGLLGSAAPSPLISSSPPLQEEQQLHYAGSDTDQFGPADIGATLIYTSGTTGTPKGCVRTADQEYARARELISTYSITAQDQQIIACPLAHSAPGIFVRAAHVAGASSIILRRFRAASFWSVCTHEPISFFFLVPTQYRRLLEACASDPVPDSLRVCTVAGAPLALHLHRRLIDWLGPKRLWQFYGSSETGTISVAPPCGEVNSSVGRLAPSVELEIRGTSGESCAPGDIGEMFVRSPTVMSHYRGEEPPPRDARFVSVGDLGYQDAKGNLFLVDRKYDTIITGGVNVYPAEVEAALLSHEGVRAAVVVGLADEDWGQRVVALVATSKACTVESLRDHCRLTLAGYKIPKNIYFYKLDEMPLGSSGKPLRRSARAMLLE
jgi:acyl-CoA synthetase (AMP-forming)/AMP-acid ligase II